jgi:hypothetical protein
MAHRLPNTTHPWTNGPRERRHRPLHAATVNTDDEATHAYLNGPLQTLLMAEHVAKRLHTRTGLTPSEHICQGWQEAPERCPITPYHYTLRLNS